MGAWRTILCILVVVIGNGCDGGTIIGNGAIEPTAMGVVVTKDDNGNVVKVADAAVSVGDLTATTDADGIWRIFGAPEQIDIPAALHVYKRGFAPIEENVFILPQGFVESELHAVALSVPFEGELGGAFLIDGSDGSVAASVQIPPGAVEVDLPDLTLNVAFVRPHIEDEYARFPGTFLAYPATAPTDLLRTFGAMSIFLDSEGVKLENVALRETATLELQVSDALPEQVYLGDTMPAWWLDTDTGIWHEEGAVEIVQRGTQKYVQMQADSFDWWNADKPLVDHACVRVVVSDLDASVPVVVQLEGRSYKGKSLARQVDVHAGTVLTGWQGQDVQLRFDVGNTSFFWPESSLTLPQTWGSAVREEQVSQADCLDVVLGLEDLGVQLGTVSGSVKDADGNAVRDARVYLRGVGAFATTDKNGLYKFENIPWSSDEDFSQRAGVDPASVPASLVYAETVVQRARADETVDFVAARSGGSTGSGASAGADDVPTGSTDMDQTAEQQAWLQVSGDRVVAGERVDLTANVVPAPHRDYQFYVEADGVAVAGGLGEKGVFAFSVPGTWDTSRIVRIQAEASGQILEPLEFVVRFFAPEANQEQEDGGSDGGGTGPELDTQILTGPSGTVTTATVSFTFASTQTVDGFECAFDSGTYVACTSPWQVTTNTNGAHRVDVRSYAGSLYDLTPASWQWNTVLAGPVVGFVSVPATQAVANIAMFETSADQEVQRRLCKINDKPWHTCGDYSKYELLGSGQQTMQVQAQNPQGMWGPVTSYTWEITGANAQWRTFEGDSLKRRLSMAYSANTAETPASFYVPLTGTNTGILIDTTGTLVLGGDLNPLVNTTEMGMLQYSSEGTMQAVYPFSGSYRATMLLIPPYVEKAVAAVGNDTDSWRFDVFESDLSLYNSFAVTDIVDAVSYQSDGTVIYADATRNQVLVAFNVLTGTELWRKSIPHPMASGIATGLRDEVYALGYTDATKNRSVLYRVSAAGTTVTTVIHPVADGLYNRIGGIDFAGNIYLDGTETDGAYSVILDDALQTRKIAYSNMYMNIMPSGNWSDGQAIFDADGSEVLGFPVRWSNMSQHNNNWQVSGAGGNTIAYHYAYGLYAHDPLGEELWHFDTNLFMEHTPGAIGAGGVYSVYSHNLITSVDYYLRRH